MRKFGIIEKENLEKIIKESFNFKTAIEKLGHKQTSKAINKRIRYWIKEYNLSTEHFNGEKTKFKKLNEYSKKIQIPLEDILIENSSYSRFNLKERLYKLGIKKRICELCGQNETWYGKKIGLILDHVNGINNDNRIENLQIVCPNCNATLDTFAGKNTKKAKDKRLLNIAK